MAPRKRAQRPRNDSDDEVEILHVYAPGTAPPPPAKRRRRTAPINDVDLDEETKNDDQEETKEGEENDEGGNQENDDTEDPELRRQRQLDVRPFLEVSYMGTTRAVIGLGFHVRELLFGDEFVSIRITNWKSGNIALLRDLVENCALAMGLQDAYATVIDHIDVDVETAPDTATVHLVNKHVAKLLLENLASSSDIFVDCLMQPLRSISTMSWPEALGPMTISGRIYVTWAATVSTGGGKIYFASAAAANAFLLSWQNHQTWFSKVKIAILGFTVDAYDATGQRIQGDAAVAERLRRRSENYAKNPSLPPLRRDYIYQDRTKYRTFFDEAEIAAMPATQVEQLEFCLSMPSQLPFDMDEHEMMHLLKPHKGEKCVVLREAPPVPAPQVAELGKRRAVAPLFACVVGEPYYLYTGATVSGRTGVYVEFTDLDHMEKVYDTSTKSTQWATMELPSGQPVRQEMEYRLSVPLSVDVYGCFRNRIAKVRIGARNNGVACTVTQRSGDKTRVDLLFCCKDEEPLRRVGKALEKAIECDKINDEDTTNVLFSHTGRVKVTELMATWEAQAAADHNAPTACVRFVDLDKSIWIYGEKSAREQAMRAVVQLSRTMQRDVQVLDRVVGLDMRKFGKSPVKPWLDKQQAVTRLYHYDVLGGGSHVIVSGSKTQVHNVLMSWIPGGYLRPELALALANEPKPQATRQPTCGVCMMPADESVVKFALCRHTFCLECIQPGVTASSRLPLECPAENCGCYIHAKDVAKISNDMVALVDAAVFDYVAKHPDECVVCPKSGCNQILSRATIHHSNGSQYIACERCIQSYCLSCSQSTGSAVERHDDVGCIEFLAAGGAAVDGYVRFIRDRIFTLCCPQCKSAFLDFDGCTSVQCGNATCGRYFCANCLVFSALDSKTTHDHVLTCTKNPQRGNYYVSTGALAKMHREQRTLQLREYLVTHVASHAARRIVLKRLVKDLADLGIAAPIDLVNGRADGHLQAIGHAPANNSVARSLLV